MAETKATPRVDVGADKVSNRARIDRAKLVAGAATITPRYQADAVFKQAVDDLVQAGVALDGAELAVNAAELALVSARGVRDGRQDSYDKSHAVCTKQVDGFAVEPGDVVGCGFLVFEEKKHGLEQPTEIRLRYDPGRALLRVHVWYPTGRHTCAIEISPSPASDATFQRLDGTGVTRALTGYAPGTWWVRAATLLGSERSDWFGPVAVVVK